MEDDILLEFLHMEIVDYVFRSAREDEKENCLSKLEYIGFNTGYRMVERLTRDWSRFKEELDIIKFICKELWTAVHKKQIDNLRTNSQGVYLLQDFEFRFLSKLSSSHQYLELAPKYVAFSSGVIRGALVNLGLTAVITAEVSPLPGCKFQIRVQRKE